MLAHIVERLRASLALKLALLVLAATGVIFGAAFAYTDRVAKEALLKSVRENTRCMARDTVNRIETILLSVEATARLLAGQMLGAHPDEPELRRIIEDAIRISPHVYGSAIAFEPDAFRKGTRAFGPYVCSAADGFRFVDLALGDYDYFSQDWYLIPRELGRPLWTEPYFDEGGGNELMCTYGVPFFRDEDGRHRVAGIATADVKLEHLTRIVSGIRLYKSGYAFLHSRNGQVLAHPKSEWVFRESIFSIAEESGDPQMRELGSRMARGEEGFIRRRSAVTGRISWFYFAPIPVSGWSVGIVVPEDEVLEDLHAMNRAVLVTGIGGFGLLLGVIGTLSAGVTRPIRSLARQTGEIAKGNLDLPVPAVRSSDEVGQLSRSFENMRVALKDYIANLAHTTAAKERIESELKIAQSIQRSFLPKRFPPFPDRSGFDIFAELQPAKEVGGDLYDFFMLDERSLFFSIGDVSGKGVPAALYMAVTKTLMKGVAEQQREPSQVLEKVNDELAGDNEETMFATIFCGILDIETGALRYTNAGHLPPLLLHGTDAPWVELPRGLLLGISEGTRYETRSLTMPAGSILVLYTDGVTEAMDPENHLFGDDRLQQLVAGRPGATPREIVRAIFEAVRGHAAGAPQSDDVTVFALRYDGRAEDQAL